MRAGELNQQITILRKVETRSASGHVIEEWKNWFTRWCKPINVSGREFFLAKQVNSEDITRFVMRRDSMSELVNDTHRVLYRGVQFNITYIEKPDRTNMRDMLTIHAREVQ